MRRLRRKAVTGRSEHALLGSPWRDVALTAVMVALTVTVFVALARQGVLAGAQRVDDMWLRIMVSSRSVPMTAIARFLDLLGLVYVTVPIRIAIAGFLAFRRRWWLLAAFLSAVVLSELFIGTLKGIYDRPRPPGSLVATSGASFPSGHSIAASVTVIAAVIALVPAGRRRAAWGAVALAFSFSMALSRAYLGAHWMSDAVAGVLLGTSCALLTALATGFLQRRWEGRREADSVSEPPTDENVPEDRR